MKPCDNPDCGDECAKDQDLVKNRERRGALYLKRMEHGLCGRCGEHPLGEGLETLCRPCADGVVCRYLQRKYGITKAERDARLKKIGHRCEVCSERGDLLVYYCRKTKRVRGLLCRTCHKLLRLLNEDADVIERALKWVERGQERDA